MKKTSLCILFGGASSEHEVSLVSSYGVLSNLDRDKYDVTAIGITKNGEWYFFDGDIEMIKDGTWFSDELLKVIIDPAPGSENILLCDGERIVEKRKIDVVFPVLHGAYGEDGSLQGLLSVAGIPYVGSKWTSSGICMDKAFTKQIVSHLGIRQAKAVILSKTDLLRDCGGVFEKVSRLGYPVFVKPANAGSSVGVSKVRAEGELKSALDIAFCEDSKVLVEEFIDGREVEVAVMEKNGECVASVPGEIDPGCDFYDYDTKYKTDSASYYIPARLSKGESARIRESAIRIFEALGCRTLSRVDFFATKDGDVVFNEINTLPGFTPISMYPKLFMQSGMTYSEIIDELVASALEG